ncbi:hypothetical protein [Nonomuraea sp. NPDC002799]
MVDPKRVPEMFPWPLRPPARRLMWLALAVLGGTLWLVVAAALR